MLLGELDSILRIDSYSSVFPRMSDLIDLSVNEMMRRTLMTSISTLLAMVGLYIFGSTMLQEFAIAMSFSIVMGTLTSIYISNVILYHFNLRDTDV